MLVLFSHKWVQNWSYTIRKWKYDFELMGMGGVMQRKEEKVAQSGGRRAANIERLGKVGAAWVGNWDKNMTQEGGVMGAKGCECFREEEMVSCQMLLRHQGGPGFTVICRVYYTGVIGILTRADLASGRERGTKMELFWKFVWQWIGNLSGIWAQGKFCFMQWKIAEQVYIFVPMFQ